MAGDVFNVGLSEMPQGTVPVLNIDEGRIVVSQSWTIARYLAKEFNLYGNDNTDFLYIEHLTETLRDMAQQYAEAKFTKDETVKAEKLKTFESEVAPKYLGFAETEIRAHGKDGFAVGDSLTLADIMVYCIIDFTCTAGALDKYPRVRVLRIRVEENKGISEYLKTRPNTSF